MLVFSDTSPISCLASLQRLDLLDAYGSVRITQAVKNELDAHPLVDARADITAALERGWLLISDDSMGGELPLLLGYELDAGEAATLAAAKSSGADLVLIDEREGRKWARRLGLRAVGTLGILLRAKRDRKLLSLRESMRLLTEVYGFSISPDLLNEACAAVGE